MKNIDFRVESKSDVGNYKKVNQDSIITKIKKIGKYKCSLISVCDGLGGLSLGEVASEAAIKQIDIWWNSILPHILKNEVSDEIILSNLVELIEKSNTEVKDIAHSNETKIGTTMSVLVCINNKYYIAHVGDSRIYIYDGELRLLTEDHTYYASLIKKGYIEESKKIKKNILTQCVGYHEDIHVYTAKGNINNNCIFMACSDGLYNKLDETFIISKLNYAKVHESDSYLRRCCNQFINFVKRKEEKDNISIILLSAKLKKQSIKDRIINIFKK